ncbi:hypothetical protein CWB99_10520 [Pseudoalteromonas rubra]|uniref:Uncharacterized protein n=1 Tax=Pseudoalteromonas rubra TaxID=43658 RepID=A0A5S3WNH8_9GAMM|nr:hypothetical protein CWC00_21200 [Pseudoalteromonas rubra]TMP28865.1 hypothetical protein CWB99_10520 [Pseudoalteromonas rubra]
MQFEAKNITFDFFRVNAACAEKVKKNNSSITSFKIYLLIVHGEFVGYHSDVTGKLKVEIRRLFSTGR